MYSYTQPVCPFETLLVMNELIKLQMYVFFYKRKNICKGKYCKKDDIPLSLNFRNWLHKAAFQHWPNKSVIYWVTFIQSLQQVAVAERNETIYFVWSKFFSFVFLSIKKGYTNYIIRTISQLCIKSIRWCGCPFSMSFYAQSVKDLQYYKKINSLKQNDGYLSKHYTYQYM